MKASKYILEYIFYKKQKKNFVFLHFIKLSKQILQIH